MLKFAIKLSEIIERDRELYNWGARSKFLAGLVSEKYISENCSEIVENKDA